MGSGLDVLFCVPHLPADGGPDPRASTEVLPLTKGCREDRHARIEDGLHCRVGPLPVEPLGHPSRGPRRPGPRGSRRRFRDSDIRTRREPELARPCRGVRGSPSRTAGRHARRPAGENPAFRLPRFGFSASSAGGTAYFPSLRHRAVGRGDRLRPRSGRGRGAAPAPRPIPPALRDRRGP